jgi:hypothetical protein
VSIRLIDFLDLDQAGVPPYWRMAGRVRYTPPPMETRKLESNPLIVKNLLMGETA